MTCIFENLYSGDINDAYSVHTRLSQITHILSVQSKPLPLETTKGLKYMYVHCLDVDDFDLLSHIPECIRFIDEGRKSGSVLVHCFAGQSRSGAVVVAYLMHHFSMDLSEALEYARKMRPAISPNDGFMRQLKLFEEMGNVVDMTSQVFKKYQVQLLSEQIQLVHFQSGIIKVPEDILSDAPLLGETEFAIYKCKKCRKTLFGQPNINPHAPKNSTTGSCSQSYFVDPLSWMRDFILTVSGKIACPGCKFKIGSFNWCGDQCGCGQWMTPSFQITHSRIDAVACNQPPPTCPR